jgi:hypothetical protein
LWGWLKGRSRAYIDKHRNGTRIKDGKAVISCLFMSGIRRKGMISQSSISSIAKGHTSYDRAMESMAIKCGTQQKEKEVGCALSSLGRAIYLAIAAIVYVSRVLK